MKRNPPKPFTPDLIITGPETNRLGFDETIHPLPGHTRGSMVISLDTVRISEQINTLATVIRPGYVNSCSTDE